jgi:hypothetical protein
MWRNPFGSEIQSECKSSKYNTFIVLENINNNYKKENEAFTHILFCE